MTCCAAAFGQPQTPARRRVQSLHQVEHVDAAGDAAGDLRGQVLDVAQAAEPRLVRRAQPLRQAVEPLADRAHDRFVLDAVLGAGEQFPADALVLVVGVAAPRGAGQPECGDVAVVQGDQQLRARAQKTWRRRRCT